MPFEEALHVVEGSLIPQLLVPVVSCPTCLKFRCRPGLTTAVADGMVPSCFVSSCAPHGTQHRLQAESSRVRYLGTAQRSLTHHFITMINTKRAELEQARSVLPKGEKLKAPSDILGAIVASQIDAEDEARLKSGSSGKQAGLAFDEIVANICKLTAIYVCPLS